MKMSVRLYLGLPLLYTPRISLSRLSNAQQCGQRYDCAPDELTYDVPMQGTVQDTLASAQQQLVSWCLPGATNEILVLAAQTFNQFSQYIIAILTLLMLLIMCVTLYTTLLAFKYKEATRHDGLVLAGAFGATMTMIYFWDFMRAIHTVLAPSPTLMFVLLWGILLFNTLFVGYYGAHALKALVRTTIARYKSFRS
jgi:hypothetical protein